MGGDTECPLPPRGDPAAAQRAACGQGLVDVPIYFPHDAHWNTVGALALPRAVVPALDRRLRVLPTDVVDTAANHIRET